MDYVCTLEIMVLPASIEQNTDLLLHEINTCLDR